MTALSSVPILAHGEQIVQGSAAIISYLDQAFPENSLTLRSKEEKAQAEEWEKLADQQIGPHVRRVCYHILVDIKDTSGEVIARIKRLVYIRRKEKKSSLKIGTFYPCQSNQITLVRWQL